MPVPLGSRAFEILAVLANSAGQLVTKNELFRRVWPGAIVEDNTLQVHISAIRKALGAGSRAACRRSSGRGYRLPGDWTVRAQRAERGRLRRRQPRRSPSDIVTNFPATAAALIGRESGRRALRDLLTAYRVVTLTGPGGIGKTVLASEVARALFPTLAERRVPGRTGLALRGRPGALRRCRRAQPSARWRAKRCRRRSPGRSATGRVLLVLDNCEHVIDVAAATVETLVRLCPNTDRAGDEPGELRVEGEVVFRVPPLETPAGASDALRPRPRSTAPSSSSSRGCSRGLVGLQPDGETLPASSQRSAGASDGVPLAIEFAAARAATLGIQDVADHLDDRFPLLTSGRRTALPRHRTLRATLDWSYELLSVTERVVFRQVAIFAGGFTMDAAHGVLVAPSLDTVRSPRALSASSPIVAPTNTSETRRLRHTGDGPRLALDVLAIDAATRRLRNGSRPATSAILRPCAGRVLTDHGDWLRPTVRSWHLRAALHGGRAGGTHPLAFADQQLDTFAVRPVSVQCRAELPGPAGHRSGHAGRTRARNAAPRRGAGGSGLCGRSFACVTRRVANCARYVD